MSKIIVPRIVVRPLLPPEGPKIGVRVQPQYLHWQVGRYKEKLTSGPGGLGRGRIWVPELEGEQHNLILHFFYDSLILQYGFLGASQYAAVGTGSAAPDPTQTRLQNEVARTNFVPSGEANAIEPQPTYGVYDVKRVYEFTESQVGGRNLTEWGFGPTSSPTSSTMNRELFRDGSGNPIVLTLDTDQRLRLIYRYRITLSPTTPQNITVNIGGVGPGPRTARFLLTGRNEFVNSGYKGFPSLPAGERIGDVLVCESLAQGAVQSWVESTAGRLTIATQTAPLTYLHSTRTLVFETNSLFAGILSYQTPSGRSRRASIQLTSNQAIGTIKSVVLTTRYYLYPTEYNAPTVNLVFDSGQEFTKDNLHKLLIANWEIVWGP